MGLFDGSTPSKNPNTDRIPGSPKVPNRLPEEIAADAARSAVIAADTHRKKMWDAYKSAVKQHRNAVRSQSAKSGSTPTSQRTIQELKRKMEQADGDHRSAELAHRSAQRTHNAALRKARRKRNAIIREQRRLQRAAAKAEAKARQPKHGKKKH